MEFFEMPYDSPRKGLLIEPKLIFDMFHGKKLLTKNAQNRLLLPRLMVIQLDFFKVIC